MKVACSGLCVSSETHISSHCCFPGNHQSQCYDVENQWRISQRTGLSVFCIYSVNSYAVKQRLHVDANALFCLTSVSMKCVPLRTEL